MAWRDGLTKGDFVHMQRPAVDALVGFVADGDEPSTELRDQLDQRGHARWYPVDGGHQVKMPFQGDSAPQGPFEIERAGWDHDHCDRCETPVYAGQDCWVTQDEDFALICSACHERLGEGGVVNIARRWFGMLLRK